MSTGWWISDLLNNGKSAELAAWTFWIIVSICLHELAHGWTALWQGDETPRVTGHMTLNPIVHMGWFSIIVFLLTSYAWGAMPVNPARFRSGRLGNMLVSFAGPAMNLLLAITCLTSLGVLLARGFGGAEPTATQENLVQFLFLGGLINVFLFAFNLLPVPPLDGSRIVASMSRRLNEFVNQPFVQQAGFFVLIVVLYQSGLGSAIGGKLHTVSLWWVTTVGRVVG